MIEAIAQALGIKASSFLAGFIGGVISLKWVPEMTTWWQRGGTAIAGGFSAAYLSPLIVGYFEVKAGAGGIDFAVGLFGMSLAAAIMRAMSGADLWGFVVSKWGGK